MPVLKAMPGWWAQKLPQPLSFLCAAATVTTHWAARLCLTGGSATCLAQPGPRLPFLGEWLILLQISAGQQQGGQARATVHGASQSGVLCDAELELPGWWGCRVPFQHCSPRCMWCCRRPSGGSWEASGHDLTPIQMTRHCPCRAATGAWWLFPPPLPPFIVLLGITIAAEGKASPCSLPFQAPSMSTPGAGVAWPEVLWGQQNENKGPFIPVLGHQDVATSDQPRRVCYFVERNLRVQDVVCGPWTTFVQAAAAESGPPSSFHLDSTVPGRPMKGNLGEGGNGTSGFLMSCTGVSSSIQLIFCCSPTSLNKRTATQIRGCCSEEGANLAMIVKCTVEVPGVPASQPNQQTGQAVKREGVDPCEQETICWTWVNTVAQGKEGDKPPPAPPSREQGSRPGPTTAAAPLFPAPEEDPGLVTAPLQPSGLDTVELRTWGGCSDLEASENARWGGKTIGMKDAEQWGSYLDNMPRPVFRGAFGGSGSSSREERANLLPAMEPSLSACSGPSFDTVIYRQGKQRQVGPTQPLGLPLAMADCPAALMGSTAICQRDRRGRGEEEGEGNYRKCRIGAGNRVNAAIALGKGCRGTPTAQSCSVELRHVLLVALRLAFGRGLGNHTEGGPDRLQAERGLPLVSLASWPSDRAGNGMGGCLPLDQRGQLFTLPPDGGGWHPGEFNIEPLRAERMVLLGVVAVMLSCKKSPGVRKERIITRSQAKLETLMDNDTTQTFKQALATDE
ncbi:RCC1 domain-containing protein 1, partial [Ophiophagus hannah]